MRLPWLQVDQDAFERGVELAALLGIDEAQAMGHIVHLWRWALSRPADPELTGIVAGPTMVVQIEAGARWRGARGALVDALVDLALLENEGTALRVKGLERYRRELQKRAEDRERKAEDREKRGTRAPSSGVPAEVHRTALGNSGQTQTQTQTQKLLPSEEDPPPLQFDLAPVDPSKPKDAWTKEDLWRHTELARRAAGLPPEKWPNRKALSELWRLGLEATDVQGLLDAWGRFAKDDHWRAKTPPLPFAAFAKGWNKYLGPKAPQRPARVDEEAFREVCQLVREAGEGALIGQLSELRWTRAGGSNLVGRTDDPFLAAHLRGRFESAGLVQLGIDAPRLPEGAAA